MSVDNVNINSTSERCYELALIAAAYRGNKEIVSLLLDRGAEVNITGGDYGSALCAAASSGHKEIVSLLLDRGADINSTGGHCGYALYKAGCKENVSRMLDRRTDVITGGDYGSALGAAASGGHKEIVSLLLDRGADINPTGGHYRSGLYKAASSGSKEIVSLLLDRGADVNITGGEYGSALGAAASGGYKEIVSLLLDRGADVNITGGDYGSALGVAAFHGHEHILLLLIIRRADVNAVTGTGIYGTALAAAALQGNTTAVSLLLESGANPNIVSGHYGTALAAASYKGHGDILSKLLADPGTDINAIGGQYGTALGAAFAAAEPNYTQISPCAKLLLDHGADINLVHSTLGSLLGKAVYEGNKKFLPLLLSHGADAFHVGGEYETVTGQYPTALDAARAAKANKDLVTLLSRIMNVPVQKMDTTPWPPFPMPFRGSLTSMKVSGPSTRHDCLETIVNSQTRTWDGNLSPAQADLPCKGFNEELLGRALVALVGLHKEAAERLQVWIRNDIRYMVNQGYDLGLAYAAARIAWKSFNDPGFNVAVHRGQWLAKAKQIDKVRGNAIYTDETGQALIKSPYGIMPRRVWDLKSNRVVEFRMLHSEVLARKCLSDSVVIDLEKAPCPPFWAITHSWTNEMVPVETSINQYQWPTPLPRLLDLEHSVRRELLSKGAEYVWLDVLCLRQASTVNDKTRVDEWKLDVPTIGNIYRAAVGIARYFNGLGQAFSTTGWDNPRHWLCRAWTLQEIRSEKTTYNAGRLHKTTSHAMLNTKSIVGGKVTTLRQALHPIVKLAAQVDGPSGCSVYELAQQMAKRYATQPTDKVAGMFYLLRTTQLPTYDAGIRDGDAWARCFHVLPFERKIEILFDFPYGSDSAVTGRGCEWFPTWKQLMEWPARSPAYDHTVAVWKQPHLHLAQAQKPEHLFVSEIWAISGILHQKNERNGHGIDIDIGNETFPFYYPYMHQKPIELSTSGRYTLVTTFPDQSCNWVVCEFLGKWDGKCTIPDGSVKMTEIKRLRKLGILRTDSSSELVLGSMRMDSILKKINALFV